MTFDELFQQAMGDPRCLPYPYQRRLAEQQFPIIVDVETGVGKTAALILSWLWKRISASGPQPRLLVYVLPMRALVEQVAASIESMLARLSDVVAPDQLPQVERMLGGDVGADWMEQPERPWVIVGTQDMLLSRALNRGYAMSPFQWPMAFGAISNDALWVIDEVQLQGIGATTAAQLQGLRDRLGCFGVTHTVFMSATIDRAPIDTADHRLGERIQEQGVVSLTDEDRQNQGVRRIIDAKKRLFRREVADIQGIADEVLKAHHEGTLSLVVVNTVERARQLARRLRSARGESSILLLHSRFRPPERRRRVEELYQLDQAPGAGAIVVSTQVVEAGIDVSAQTLFTDCAPWSSIVQRLGRCNRRGFQDGARAIWFDDQTYLKRAWPYADDEVAVSRERLITLEGSNVSPAALRRETVAVTAVNEGAVVRLPDLLDLFDTTPDLTGSDVDVARFIRDDGDTNVFLFWRAEPPAINDPPQRDELCPVPVGKANDLMKRLGRTGRPDDARIVQPLARPPRRGERSRRWERAPQRLRPGEMVWLAVSVGAYDEESGFDIGLLEKASVAEVSPRTRKIARDVTVEDDVPTFIGSVVSLAVHSSDAAQQAALLVAGLPPRSVDNPTIEGSLRAVEIAARWHDAGKVHDVFQRTMLRSGNPEQGGPWAKSAGRMARHDRRYFRHELVSSAAWLVANAYADTRDVNLVAYLIAAHHGKLRLAPHTMPGECLETSWQEGRRTILGVAHGDAIPGVDLGEGVGSPEFTVDLTLFDVAPELSNEPLRSVWSDRVLALRDDPMLGPFRLAFLELLVRLADWRASALRGHLTAGQTAATDDTPEEVAS